GALLDDPRNIRKRLDVIDHGRRSESALDCRKWRTIARVAALSFKRFEQAGLFATNVGSGAPMGINLDVEARAHDVLAEVALGLGFGDCGLNYPGLDREFPAKIHIGDMCAHGPARDQDSFKYLMRIHLELVAVCKSAGFTFVGVAAQINRLLRVF